MLTEFYAGKRVLVTGHTGFKGGWLSLWLKRLGASVCGLALAPEQELNLYSLVRESSFEREFIADIRVLRDVQSALEVFQPQLVFHLAAQSLVRRSYRDPAETFQTNTVGTLNLLEAARNTGLPAALVVITTDKCYENREWEFAYRENDALGGIDPYSASKAAAELVVQSYRESYFRKESVISLASARAGNVIGGGDYAADRIIPDAIRAVIHNRELIVRNPHATRPWQHVLDCLSGYLILGQALHQAGADSQFAGPFNFGPGPQACYPVSAVVSELSKALPLRTTSPPQESQPHEASRLNLTIDKAAALLNWTPTWTFHQAVAATASWYAERHIRNNADMLEFSLSQIAQFEAAKQTAQ